MRAVRHGVAACAVVLALGVWETPLGAYLKFTVPIRGVQTVLKWPGTVRWFARDAASNGVSASDFQSAVARAFSTWEAVPSATIDFSFVGFTRASPFEDDGISVLGFESVPQEDRVLGSTGFTIDLLTGNIVEADIFFNAIFPWSTATGGDSARYDLESVALHEIGHLLGLGHSAIGETQLLGPDARRVLASGAVMFPIAFGRGNTLDRRLQPDDIAGASSLYPVAQASSRTGSIRGRITKNGRGVFGAHVTAFNIQTGETIGGFAVTVNGDFEVAGLSPGPHVVRVEPLDDASTESFFDAADPVDASFSVTYADRVVAVAAGAQVTVDVAVQSR